MLNVTDLIPVGGGQLITFDDNSVATAIPTVINGQLVLDGLTTEQAEALARFNQQNIPQQIQQLDARYGAIQNTAIASQEQESQGLAGDVAQNTSDISTINTDIAPASVYDDFQFRTSVNRQLYQRARLVSGDLPGSIWPITNSNLVMSVEGWIFLVIEEGGFEYPISLAWTYIWPDTPDYTGSKVPIGINVYQPSEIPDPGEISIQDSYILPFASGQMMAVKPHPDVGSTSPAISPGDHLTPSPLGTVTQWQSGYWDIGIALDISGGWVIMRGISPDNSTGSKGGPTPTP
jgi:hypothetical protein